MSKKRYISDYFWEDPFIEDLDPTEKLLFLFVLTNSKVKTCWIYEISLRHISFYTWIDKDMVLKILWRFEQENKIFYSDWMICIVNFVKNLWISKEEDNLWKAVTREVKEIGSTKLERMFSNKYLVRSLQGTYQNYPLLYLTLLNLTLPNSTSQTSDRGIKEFIDFANTEYEKLSSAYFLKALLALWYIPAESETVETFRKRFKEKVLDRHNIKCNWDIISIIDNFETYWQDNLKKPTNYKSTFLNNPLLKDYKK